MKDVPGPRSGYWAHDVRALRDKLRVSQESFGRLMGVCGLTVSRWERGCHKPQNDSAIVLNIVLRAASLCSRDKVLKALEEAGGDTQRIIEGMENL